MEGREVGKDIIFDRRDAFVGETDKLQQRVQVLIRQRGGHRQPIADPTPLDPTADLVTVDKGRSVINIGLGQGILYFTSPPSNVTHNLFERRK